MRSGTSEADYFQTGHNGISGFMRRQAQRLAGAGLLAFSAFAIASLASWNVADPSFSHATDNAVTNAMGFAGAAFSDLAMQFFGLASVAILVPAVIWGVLLVMAKGPDARARRGGFWFLYALGACALLSLFPAPSSWPLPIGLGGVAGDMVLRLPGLLTGGYPSGILAWLAGILLLPASLYCLVRASGLTDRVETRERPEPAADRQAFDDEDEEGGFPALGLITHWWLSAQAALRRRFPAAAPRAASSSASQPRAPWRDGVPGLDDMDDDEGYPVAPVARPRVEPGFDASGAAPQPQVSAPQRRIVVEHPPVAAAQPAAIRPPVADADIDDDGLPWDDITPDTPLLSATQPRGTAHVQHGRTMARQEPRMGMPGQPGAMPGMQPHVAAAPVAVAPQEAVRRADPGNRLMEPVQGLGAAPAAARVQMPAAAPLPGARVQREAQPSFIHDGGFEMPSLHFLSEAKAAMRDPSLSEEALEQNARLLEGVLDDFGVKGEIIHVRPGPVVTLYELEPAPGIKSSRVIGLADDIARSMSAIAARVAVVPGRNAIGIELPNAKRETVYLRELLASRDFETSKAKLALGLGKTINGEAVIADLAKMPHLLVAGTTGSGKSVAINTMILSLLYRMTPEQCRLIMIDPKMLELSIYDGIPHLLTPVVTDPKKAVVALKWTVKEMEDRYRKMSKVGVRNIDGFNQRVTQADRKGEKITRTVQTGFDRETGEAIYESEELNLEPMPYIVVIIDEMADLMMVAGKDIEGTVQRLAQMARAAGIHVIMATQRPSVDVITGTIKANFPTRISFQVTSKIDSRTILGEQGAEQLLGMGDMLYMAGGGRIQRVHGPFVADEEVEQVVSHLKLQGVPEYLDSITEEEDEDGDSDAAPGNGGAMGDSDDPYDQAVAVVLRDGKASTSYIQRRLGIGYNRAASIIERMEDEGIVGPANHAGKREILVPRGPDADEF